MTAALAVAVAVAASVAVAIASLSFFFCLLAGFADRHRYGGQDRDVPSRPVPSRPGGHCKWPS